jgi:hypothetical protein
MSSATALEAVFRRLMEVPADATGFRVAPVAEDGQFLAAIDPSDRRHILAPVLDSDPVVPDARSAGIQVTRRELIDAGQTAWFVDVASGDARFNELFAIVADEVIDRWRAAADGRPDLLASAVIDRWRDLLAIQPKVRSLTLDETIGLIGELLVLRDLGGNVDLWAGPLGGRHDFVSHRVDLEVKSTRVRAGYEVEIHSLDQLTAPPEAQLYLVFNRLEEVPVAGDSIGSLVDALVSGGADSHALVERIAALSATSELLDPSPRRFRLLERQVYAADEDFPRLSVGDVRGWPKPGVTYVHYGLDLAAGRQLGAEVFSGIARSMQAMT